jgi:hypothetical protein
MYRVRFARTEAKTKHLSRPFITRPLVQFFSCVIDLRRHSGKNESENCTRVKNSGDCTHTHAGLMYSLSREEILIELISSRGSEFGRGLLSYCCHINRTQELCAADGKSFEFIDKKRFACVCD